MSTSLGRLKVFLGLDAVEFVQGLDRAHARAEKFAQRVGTGVTTATKAAGAALGALGLSGTGAFVAFDKLVKQGGEFQDLAERMGDAAESVASLAVSARIGGVEMTEVADLSAKLTRNLTGVTDESKAAGAALKAMGLDIAEFKRLSPTEQIETLAKALAGFTGEQEKAAAIMALAGKSGSQFLPFLKELAEGTGRVNILTSEQIRLADEYADRQAKSRAELNLHAHAIATQMLPAYTALQEALTDTAKDILGVKTASNHLRNDNAVTEWALGAVESLASAVESVENLVRAIRVAGVTIAAQAAKFSKRDAVGVVPIIGPALRAIMPKDEERNGVIDQMVRDEVDGILGANRLSERIRQRVAQVRNTMTTEFRREAEKFARQAAANNPKKRLVFDGVDDEAGPALKAQLDGQLRAIRDFAQNQREGFEFANEYLKGAYDEGIMSLRDFFARQAALRDEGLRLQIEAYDREIAALEDFKGKALKPQERVDAENKIADATAKRAAAVRKAGQEGMLSAQQEAAAIRQLTERYQDLQAQVLQLSGDEAGAARIRIARQVEEARRVAMQQGADPGIADRLGTLLTLTERRTRLQQEHGQVLERTRNLEDAAHIAAQLAGTTEIETLRHIGAIRQSALGDMQRLAQEARELAERLKTPEAQLFAQQLAVGLARARAEAEPLFQRLREVGQEAGAATASHLEQAILEGKRLRDVIRGIEQDILRIVTRNLVTKPLGDWLSNLFGGNGTSSGGGGILGTIFRSIFGGGRASGGPVEPGRMYRVNERAPELLDVNGRQFLMMGNQRGRVTPLSNARSGGNTYNITYHAGPGETRATIDHNAVALLRILRRAEHRFT